MSTTGAYHGTGLASSDGLTYNAYQSLLFFQHADGSIRTSTKSVIADWSGGDSSAVVVPGENVRNGTAIASNSYWEGNTTYVSSGL